MKKIPIMVALAFRCLFLQGQDLPQIHLKKGDTVSNVTFPFFQGDNTFWTRLNDYKGKLIILDFWSIHCGSCIVGMPHMLALQEQFKDKIQIFIVTQDSKEDVIGLWHKLKGQVTGEIIAAGQKLAFIYSDTTFNKMFPTNTWGTHVWIDKNLVCKAFAYDNSTTADNINLVLNGKEINWATYYKPDLSGEEVRDWMTKRIGFTDHLLTYSLFTKYDERTQASGRSSAIIRVDSATKKENGINCFNQTALELYMRAYFGNFNRKKNHILLEVSELDRFYPPDELDKMYDWQHNNRFCYALKFVPSQDQDLYAKMREDLDNFFHFNSKIENRSVKCIVLKRIGMEDKLRSRGKDDQYETIAYYNTRKLVIHNQPMLFLEQEIYNNYIISKMPFTPFYDETGYQNNIDIELPWGGFGKDYSISELRISLQKYGLDLVEEYKNINVLVIKNAIVKNKNETNLNLISGVRE